MILVLIFLAVIAILSLLIIILFFSNIKININHIYISNLYSNLKINFMIKIEIYLFNKVKILSFKIEKEKLKKQYNDNIKILKTKNSKKINKEIMKILLKTEFIIEKVEIQGNISMEDAFFTAITVGIINSIIPILAFPKMKEVKEGNYSCTLSSQFINQNILNLYANIIINLRIKEILSQIIKMNKTIKSYHD